MNINTRQPISRRTLLRGGAIALGLPWLEAMGPSLGKRALAADFAQNSPRRFVACCATLGFHTPFLFPETPGKQYEVTPYLERLADHRDQLTVISGLSHPEQQGNNGHASELTWLTSAKRPGLAGFRNTISLDQRIAQEVGIHTRFPSLVLSTSGRSMSWTASGVEIPGMQSPKQLFSALFIDGTEKEVSDELKKLDRNRSILDTVGLRAQNLSSKISVQDRRKLDEYLSAIRELETRLQQSKEWVTKPKPQVQRDQPTDVTDRNDAIAKQKLMYELIALALQTDSSRTVTFQLSGMNAVPTIPGVQNDWHNLSHHGKDPEKIEELKIIEEAEFDAFNGFLTMLEDAKEGDSTLLNQTAVLYGSNLGNASAHNWTNLPILVAGGGFEHGSYLAHDDKNNTALCNLYVQIAQQMGVEIDRFGSSDATGITGLKSIT